jgi:RHS repeat-associated protein
MSSYAEHWRTRRLRIIVSRACTGNVVQTLDFYPYGSTRISVATSTNEKRKFIGQFTDDSSLSYLNAGYYDGNRGQFLTEDPTSLAVGDPSKLQQLTQKQQQELLRDPQTLNAYGYARDNPITNKDATGLISQSEIDLLFKTVNGISGAEAAKSYYEANYSDATNPQVEAHAQAQSYYDAGTFAPSFAVTYGLVNADPVTGFLIDTGNFALMGYDKYCSGHICKTWGQDRIVPFAEMINNIPTGPISGSTVSRSSSNGSPILGNGSSNPNKQTNGGVSGPQSITGLYQSLVSILTSYYIFLSGSSGNSGVTSVSKGGNTGTR